ncbi:MAG: hypothetical protein ACRC46_09725 [Thermoguttaceae bacterium]
MDKGCSKVLVELRNRFLKDEKTKAVETGAVELHASEARIGARSISEWQQIRAGSVSE